MLTFTRCSLWSNVLPCQFCGIVRSWPSEICYTMGWKPFLNFHSFMSLVQVNLCEKLFFLQNMFSPGSELGIFMYWTSNSMNNLSSYCGLVDAKIRASHKDFPVKVSKSQKQFFLQLHCPKNEGNIWQNSALWS